MRMARRSGSLAVVEYPSDSKEWMKNQQEDGIDPDAGKKYNKKEEVGMIKVKVTLF